MRKKRKFITVAVILGVLWSFFGIVDSFTGFTSNFTKTIANLIEICANPDINQRKSIERVCNNIVGKNNSKEDSVSLEQKNSSNQANIGFQVVKPANANKYEPKIIIVPHKK